MSEGSTSKGGKQGHIGLIYTHIYIYTYIYTYIHITEHMSIPDQRWTVHFTWSPGATSYKLLLRKDSPGWEKAENKFTATSGLPVCVCVCPVSPPYMHVCVPVCRVCHCDSVVVSVASV